MARVLALSIALVASSAFAREAARKEVDERLAAISAASGGTLGVSAINLGTGERVRFNADQSFPMASTFKVPVAIRVLADVQRGALRLDEKIVVDAGNLSPGSGELEAAEGAGRAATVAELLELMLRNSDNTATDHLLARVGGPKAVTAHVHAMGITPLEVNRPAAQLVADAWGFKLPPAGTRTRQNLRRAQGAVPADKRAAAARAFLADAMAAVLEQLRRGKALDPGSTRLLLGHMENCRTGPKRLKGEMPRGVAVAHKTGTLTRIATNDVGIVPLGWSNAMVVAIYLKGSPQPLAAQERAIAEAALAVYRFLDR
jgi:beta-lactamase class A